jgi:hypothetical protein
MIFGTIYCIHLANRYLSFPPPPCQKNLDSSNPTFVGYLELGTKVPYTIEMLLSIKLMGTNVLSFATQPFSRHFTTCFHYAFFLNVHLLVPDRTYILQVRLRGTFLTSDQIDLCNMFTLSKPKIFASCSINLQLGLRYV